MIELIQNESGIIGNQKAVDELAVKENAAVLLISDSHGSYSVFSQIVRDFGKNCDALIFTGDGISDLSNLLNNAGRSEELMAAIPPVIAFVQGNNDPPKYPVSRGLSLNVPEKQVLTVCGQKILIVHGHRQGISFGFERLAFEAQLNEAKIITFGHTHISGENYYGNDNEYKFINPGSCSLPRGGLPASFAVMTFMKNCQLTSFMKITRNSTGRCDYSSFTPFGF